MTVEEPGTGAASVHHKSSPGGQMESLILRIEADIKARKQARIDVVPLTRWVALLVFGFLIAFELGAQSVDPAGGWMARALAQTRLFSLRSDIDDLRGQLEFQTLQAERFKRAYDYSSHYRIAADLALSIHEIALAENIDPHLAFELVRVESEFNPRAVSRVGAIGYTQIMPETARLLSPGITRAQLFDRDTNLRLGFRFLRSLVRHYNGDIRLALIAYNRGPQTVDQLLVAGKDPGNGYARAVLGAGVQW